jgi:hypothetical protein
LSLIGVHIDELATEPALISSSGNGPNDSHVAEKLHYDNLYLITLDDVVVAETVNRRQSHILYGQALENLDSM